MAHQKNIFKTPGKKIGSNIKNNQLYFSEARKKCKAGNIFPNL